MKKIKKKFLHWQRQSPEQALLTCSPVLTHKKNVHMLTKRDNMYRPAAHLKDDGIYLPAGQLGMGWWGDAWDGTAEHAKARAAGAALSLLGHLASVFPQVSNKSSRN